MQNVINQLALLDVAFYKELNQELSFREARFLIKASLKETFGKAYSLKRVKRLIKFSQSESYKNCFKQSD